MRIALTYHCPLVTFCIAAKADAFLAPENKHKSLPVSFYIDIENPTPFWHRSIKNYRCCKFPNGRKSLYFQGLSQFKTFLENKIKYYFLFLIVFLFSIC